MNIFADLPRVDFRRSEKTGRLWRHAPIALAFLCACAAAPTHAQDAFPSRPLRLVVPFGPGGGTDTTARLVGQKLTEDMGQPVVVDNRPGGGSIIASEIIANSPPDGYTMYLATTGFTTAPALHKKLPFDPNRDFAPVTLVAVTPAILVVNEHAPVKSAKALIALSKAEPTRLSFGSAGVGSASHLAGVLFNMTTGAHLVHVPYKSSAAVTTALLSGEVQVGFIDPASAIAYVRNGRLRVLGTTTSVRSPLLPDVPTLAEEGITGYDHKIWNGVLVAGKTSPKLIARLHDALAKALSSPDVVSRMANYGSRPSVDTPAQFGVFLKEDMAKWVRVVKEARIPVN